VIDDLINVIITMRSALHNGLDTCFLTQPPQIQISALDCFHGKNLVVAMIRNSALLRASRSCLF